MPEATEDPYLRASFLDALGEAVVATDRDGHILYWNDAATRLYGWAPDEVLGSRADHVLMAEGTARAAAVVLERLRRRGRWSGEFLVRHRDGRVFPVLITASTVCDAAGRPTGLVGVTRDISTQRRAEEKARHAEERVELVHRAASSVIWEWDMRSGVVQRNNAVADAFGYPPEDVEASLDWWRARIHPEDRPRVAESFDRFLHEDRRFWTEEYRFLTANRGYATVFDRAYMAHDHDGQPVRVVGTMVDLTERRRIHEQQRFLSQASMILELSLDYESTLPTIARLAVNNVAETCVIAVNGGEGFPPFVTGAHKDPRLQAVVDEGVAHLLAGAPLASLLDQVMESRDSALVANVPAEAARLLGPVDDRLGEMMATLAPASALIVPLRARRAGVGYVLLASSAKDRPYDEGDLQMGEELGRRVGLTVDHARLFQSAELANRAKSDFLAVISHELRTPLTAVLGYADLLREEVAGPLNEAQHRQVDRIRAGSDRLLRLIEGILAFARLETGRERPHFNRVELRALFRHLTDMVRASATDKGVDFRLDLDAAPAAIRTDPDRFLQVVLSLVTNAIKFTDQGAVLVAVSTHEGRVRVDVTDSGGGIAPEHLPHIFNPFWQAEQATTRRTGGAGLGLSIARRLARLMNGDVVVAGTTSEGTTFRFEVEGIADGDA